MNLPPPTSNPDSAQSHEAEDPDSTPMEQSCDTTVESGDTNEAVEAKTGVKRALSMSPQASGESHDAVEVSSTGGRGPEIKRRNVDMYSGDTETPEEP
jgi:hypothetical protein